MILEKIIQIRDISNKKDKAYILDEIALNKPQYQELLKIIFDKDVRFFVDTNKVKNGLSGIMPLLVKYDIELDMELLELLKMLSSEELRGNAGITKCINFADQLMPDEIEMFINILDNKTRLGIGSTDINKYCKNFNIKEFQVMYAQRNDKVKIDWKQKYFIQPKIDGNRCIEIKYPLTRGQFYSRKGKEITSLERLQTAISEKLYKNSFVMDGEIEFGTLEETGAIRRKTDQVDEAIYTIFGAYSLDEWNNGIHTEPYSVTLEKTKELIYNLNIPNLRIIPTYIIDAKSEDEFYSTIQNYKQNFIDQGYEGAMLKTCNHVYQPSSGTKRSKDWIKFKPQETTEGKVIEIIEGEGEHLGMVGKFVVKWLDATFEVSPGKIKHTQRKYIFENPEEFLNRDLEFYYQQLNKYGIPRDTHAIKFRDDK